MIGLRGLIIVIYRNYIMNAMKYICLILFSSILLGSCLKDESEYVIEDERTTLKLNISTLIAPPSTLTNSGVLGDAESVINRCVVFAFDGDVYDTHSAVTTSSGSENIELAVLNTKRKSLYVFANYPEEMHEEIINIRTVRELKALDFTIAKHCNSAISRGFNSAPNQFDREDFDLPMSGVKAPVNIKDDYNDNDVIDIYIERSLARIDVYVQRENDAMPKVEMGKYTTLTFKNTRDIGYFLYDPIVASEGGTPIKESYIQGAPLVFPAKVEGNSMAVRAFSFYTAEFECADNDSKIQFSMDKIWYEGAEYNLSSLITVGADIIKRNYVYKVICTVTRLGIELDDIQILDWSDEPVSGDIGGSLSTISAPNNVLMQYEDATYGEGYSKTISYKGSESVRLFIDDVEVTYVDNITSIETENHPWLESVLWKKGSSNDGGEGELIFTYRLMSGIHPPCIVKLKSGSAIRKIRVEYAETLSPLPKGSIINMDYARFVDLATGERGSFTANFLYLGNADVKNISFGSNEWLTSVSTSIICGRNVLSLKYQPYLIDQIKEKKVINVDGKVYTVKYDNGCVPNFLMSGKKLKNTYVEHRPMGQYPPVENRNNWAPEGFHFARRGVRVDPFINDNYGGSDENVKWQVGGGEIGFSTSALAATKYQFNQGIAQTEWLNKDSAEKHPVIYDCIEMGNGYYLPSISELKWIFNKAHPYLGDSYKFKEVYVWSATEDVKEKSFVVYSESGYALSSVKSKIGYKQRCIKNL